LLLPSDAIIPEAGAMPFIMIRLIDLPTFTDDRGSLTVIEKVLPFPVRRLFYIYGNKNRLPRGGHKHKTSKMALIALSGSCETILEKGQERTSVRLDTPSKCLIIGADYWVTLDGFSPDCILLALSSSYYDADDYVYKERP